MNFSILITLPAYFVAFFLFIAMVFAAWVGNRFAKIRLKKNPDIFSEGIGSLEGALLGLVALLLAFTFSMSASRFDERRHAIVAEANIIGTAILRADLYPDSIRTTFRKDFKQYVEARIDYYTAGADINKVLDALNKSNVIAHKIWNKAADLGKDPAYFVSTNQMIPALNDMIDIITTRLAGGLARVPDSIVWLLFLLCVVGSFVVGYGNKGKKLDWIVIVGFCLMISLTIYLILDLDRPRRGFINMDSANQRIVDLRGMFDE